MKYLACLLLTPVLSWLAWQAIPYAVADLEFNRLARNSPTTRTDVEDLLIFYRSRRISIKESAWGKAIKLQPGQYCQQYQILRKEPIDIVYDHDGRVVHMLSSYE